MIHMTKRKSGKRWVRIDDPVKFIHEVRSKKPPVVNTKLEKVMRSMVKDTFRKDLRKDAMKLLMLASKERVQEFLYHYHSDHGNVCCLVLDAIADGLTKEGKMPKGVGKEFGLLGRSDEKT